MSSQIDTVCGMPVDPKKTPYKTIYMGRIYYFCCKRCLEEFEKNPGLYVKS